LDAGSGRVLWSTGKAGASFNVPALASMSGEPTLMVLATNSLVAVQLKDGREQWRVPFGAGYFCHAADPIVQGDSVFIGSADAGSQLIRFSSGKPEIVWQNRSLGNFTATSVFFDGYLYGINLCDSKDSGAELRCLDWKTGALKWAEKGYGQGSFLCAGNKMLLLSDKGELTVARFSPDRFELLRRDQVIGGKCWTPPSLARGKLYVRNAAGDLICLDLSSVKAG
jgi:outer membrane protein assembly factor BamB